MTDSPHRCRGWPCKICSRDVAIYFGPNHFEQISREVDYVIQDRILCGDEESSREGFVKSGEDTSRATDFVISGEETSRAKYYQTVFEKSRGAIYGNKYMKEGQMEGKNSKEGKSPKPQAVEAMVEEHSVPEFEIADDSKDVQPVRESDFTGTYAMLPLGTIDSNNQVAGYDDLAQKFKRVKDDGVDGDGDRTIAKIEVALDEYAKFRYPSYPETGWKRPGIGAFQAKECLERQMESARENSEGQVVGEEIKERQEQQMERAQYFEPLSSSEELKDFMLKYTRALHYVIKDPGKSAGFFNFSVSEDFHLSVSDAMNAQNWDKVERLIMPIAMAFPGRAAVSRAYFISAAILLSMVYHYLQGAIDRGGGKTSSSGSLEFRSTYISIVLFPGAYVWIKFRDVACVRRTSRVNKNGMTVYRYEPRFKLPGSKKYISLGSYEREVDVVTMYHIIAFLCGKEGYGRELKLVDGTVYRIPLMEEAQGIDQVEALRKRTKEVFEDFQASDSIAFLESVLPSDTDHAQFPSCDGTSAGMDMGYTENVLPNWGWIPPSLQDTMGVNDPSHLHVSVTNDFANRTLDESRGDRAWGEQPSAPYEAPVGDGAPGEQPPDSRGASDADFGDGAPGDQPPDPNRPFQDTSLMDSDYLSLQREVNALRRKNELLELERKHQTERSQLHEQHNQERIAELEGEVALLRSRVCSRKRSRTSRTSFTKADEELSLYSRIL